MLSLFGHLGATDKRVTYGRNDRRDDVPTNGRPLIEVRGRIKKDRNRPGSPEGISDSGFFISTSFTSDLQNLFFFHSSALGTSLNENCPSKPPSLTPSSTSFSPSPFPDHFYCIQIAPIDSHHTILNSETRSSNPFFSIPLLPSTQFDPISEYFSPSPTPEFGPIFPSPLVSYPPPPSGGYSHGAT